MQHMRIYYAWLPSEIYSPLFSPILQHYHISKRFQRATKGGKFLHAVWEFDELNEVQLLHLRVAFHT